MELSNLTEHMMALFSDLESEGVDEIDRVIVVVKTEDDRVMFRTSGSDTFNNIDTLARAIALECGHEREDD